MKMHTRTIEVCCSSLADALAAREGGADRIELCAALETGGITPSFGLAEETLRRCADHLKVNILIRPRGGDFVYDETEIRQMMSDIAMFRRIGASGVVIGALGPEGDIDMDTCRRLMEAARGSSDINPPVSVTFHRAFDVCRDPFKALEDIIALGCDRILTSGQAAAALEGADCIRELIDRADGRITIMPGCGIAPENIREIESRTRAVEFHASARGEAQVRTVHSNPRVDFGENRPRRHADAQVVKALKLA